MVHVNIRICSFSSILKKYSSTSVASAKNNYYQKIGHQSQDQDDNVKPEGWNKAKRFEEIPSLKPLPMIGNTWRFFPGGEFYNVKLVDMYKRLYNKFGNITYLSGLVGVDPMIVLFDPNDFEQVFRNDGPWPRRQILCSVAYYRKRIRPEVYQGVDGLVTVHGEEWFKIRTTVNKVLMQPRTIEMYVDSMDDVANDLLKLMRFFAKKDANSEMPNDFQNQLYKWTLESVGVVAYNRRIGCLNPNLKSDSEGQKFINAVKEMFDLLFKLDFRPSMWRIVSTKDWRKFVRVMDIITDLNQRYITECLATVDPNDNIPDHERSALERLARIDKKVAVVTASDMLIAGVDTTGKAVASTMYFLAKNLQVQEKLREELKNVMPSKDTAITKEILNLVPYLKAVIKESFRIAPVASANARETVKDMVLAGYQIPKGTQIVMLNSIACSDEKNFPEPNKFIPERWLRTTTDKLSHKIIHPFVYLPFGFGPRSCVGKRLANLETEVGLAKIVRNFKLSWNYPDATFASGLLYGIASPLNIKVEEIEN